MLLCHCTVASYLGYAVGRARAILMILKIGLRSFSILACLVGRKAKSLSVTVCAIVKPIWMQGRNSSVQHGQALLKAGPESLEQALWRATNLSMITIPTIPYHALLLWRGSSDAMLQGQSSESMGRTSMWYCNVLQRVPPRRVRCLDTLENLNSNARAIPTVLCLQMS